GPDSAGIAVYHSAVPEGQSKITLFNADTGYGWKKLAADLGKALGVKTEIDQEGNHARLIAVCPQRGVRPSDGVLKAHRPARRCRGALWPCPDGRQPRDRPYPHGDRER